MKAIASYFGVHYSTVSRAVSGVERGRGNGRLLLAGRETGARCRVSRLHSAVSSAREPVLPYCHRGDAQCNHRTPLGGIYGEGLDQHCAT